MLWFVRVRGVRGACVRACECVFVCVSRVWSVCGWYRACVCQHTCTSPNISSTTDITTRDRELDSVTGFQEKLVRSTGTFLLL